MATKLLQKKDEPVLAPCGVGCRFAETSPSMGEEWIWCARPAAPQRLMHEGRDCRYFTAATEEEEREEAAGKE